MTIIVGQAGGKMGQRKIGTDMGKRGYWIKNSIVVRMLNQDLVFYFLLLYFSSYFSWCFYLVWKMGPIGIEFYNMFVHLKEFGRVLTRKF